MLRKRIDCKSLENFLKNVSDGVRFSKIASLCCTNCNSSITSIHNRFFSKYVPKNYFLGSTTRVPPHGFWKIALYKISEQFFRDNFVISHLTKLQATNLQVSTLLKRKCLTKIYRTSIQLQRRLSLSKRKYLYLNNDAEMPMLRFPSGSFNHI